MARITPLKREDLEQFSGLWQIAEMTMGFVPSSMPTMAHVDGLVEAFGPLAGTIQHGGQVSSELKMLVSYVTSRAAGCRYCQAHTSAHAAHAGVSTDKLEAVWEFEQSDLFSDAERAALRLAVAGGLSPVQATDEHFDESILEMFRTARKPVLFPLKGEGIFINGGSSSSSALLFVVVGWHGRIFVVGSIINDNGTWKLLLFLLLEVLT